MMLRVKTNPLHARVDFAMLNMATQASLRDHTPETPKERVWALQKLATRYIHFLEKHFEPNPVIDIFNEVLKDTEDLDKALSQGTLSEEAALKALQAVTEKSDKALMEFVKK